jgi:hypothetical protein
MFSRWWGFTHVCDGETFPRGNIFPPCHAELYVSSKGMLSFNEHIVEQQVVAMWSSPTPGLAGL